MKNKRASTYGHRYTLTNLCLSAFIGGSVVMAIPAWATMTINSAGSGGAPLTVGSAAAVQVLPSDGGRVNWALEPESGDLRCAFGDGLGNAPGAAPTATVGFLIPYVKGQLWKETGAVARLRLDCIAVSSPTAVDTAEEKP